jgi:2,4-dienoyl-CoA reductase-like NADH-dependent reductase (Old Yellow Enzyme family)
MNSPLLFAPITLGPLSLSNRIMVSPMCQYSAIDGCATAWHTAHLSSLALSGAGLLCIEATAVSPEGRITEGCLGLYSDAQEAALKQLIATLRASSPVKLAIQLGHAGRKASSARPWDGGALITPTEGGWQTLAPSAIPHKPEEEVPHAMSLAQITHLKAAFVDAAQRALRLGMDAIELHAAHGYLLHQFLSPLSNQREDAYGGSAENRMRLVLEIFSAVKAVVGSSLALGVRVSATDWVEGGWDLEQTKVLATRLQALGADFIDVSSGGLSPAQKIVIGPGYQVGFAEQLRQGLTMPVISVGLITEPQQAETILQSGQADMVALARTLIVDPRWPWRAAMELKATVPGAPQYFRCLPSGSPRIFGDAPNGQR